MATTDPEEPVMTRRVDESGVVWQEGTHGERIVGQVYRLKSGRCSVIMCGRRVRRTRTWESAVAMVLEWEPEDDDDQAVMDHVLDPTGAGQP